MQKIKLYCCHRMAGRDMSDLVKEAARTTRVIENYGFEVCDPIIMEKIPNVSEILTQLSEEQLRQRWKEDKTAIKDADVILEYMGCNKSDGCNVEVGYGRFCLFKPVIRVWPNATMSISKIEYDHIVPSLIDAMELIKEKYGTYEKLGKWREAMWQRCFSPWIAEQFKMHQRYGIYRGYEII